MSKLTLLAAGLACFSLLAYEAFAAHQVSGAPAARVQFLGGDGPAGPSFAPGRAVAAAHLGQAQAIAAAVHEFGTIVTAAPHTVAYGAFTDDRYAPPWAGGRPLGTVDAWEIQLTGLDLSPPCGYEKSCGDAIQTFTIVIDDKSGNFVEGIASQGAP